MIRLFTVLRVCFTLIVVNLVGGCGGPSRIATFPVSGKVTFNGRPVVSGQVSFSALDEKVVAGLCTGAIGPNGEYKIYSDGKPGAPLGKYKVTVMPSMSAPMSGGATPAPAYNACYWNFKTTPLTKEVVSNAVEGAYDLTLTK